MRQALALILATTMALPAVAQGPQNCWDTTSKPGLFNWQTTPSLACREGKTVTGTPVARAESQPQPMAAPPTQTEPAPQFTFGGEVYFGVAVRVR